MRYLGVPLITTKLQYADCKTLIDKITSRIKTWTNRYLTYAGRIQLISSVLSSMHTYWCSLFILPKKVIKEVEGLLRAFFWSGPDLKRSGAKVSWEHICSPKVEGGLGFKSMEICNKVAIVKHIWFLISGGEQSMWCQWVKSYLLKDRSFWSVGIPGDSSWIWRKMLGLRSSIQNYIRIVIGDGESTYLWHDYWSPLGSLFSRFGHRIMLDSGIPPNSKVSSIVNGDRWSPPVSNT